METGELDDLKKWAEIQNKNQMYTYREPYHTHPCPSCGHCPTCGRGGYWQTPYQPYWQIPVMTVTY